MKEISTSCFLVFTLLPFVFSLDWQDGSPNTRWSMGCDFFGNDLTNIKINGENCGQKCSENPSCTHFTWTNHEGGTCWMKQGAVSEGNARVKNDEGAVCGYLNGRNSGGGSEVTAKGTRWADSTDSGGCQLPVGSYKITHALALGQQTSLGSLAWRNGLCGQVMQVKCGGSAVEAVVASTCNLGSTTCGVDLITKTWNLATGNKPPGEASCTVQLSNTAPLNGGAPQCYYRPFSGGLSPYYTSLGFFNTGGKIVKGATLAGVTGKFQSGSSYIDFDAQGSPKFTNSETVSVTYEDGSSASFKLENCMNPNNVQIFK